MYDSLTCAVFDILNLLLIDSADSFMSCFLCAWCSLIVTILSDHNLAVFES